MKFHTTTQTFRSQCQLGLGTKAVPAHALAFCLTRRLDSSFFIALNSPLLLIIVGRFGLQLSLFDQHSLCLCIVFRVVSRGLDSFVVVSYHISSYPWISTFRKTLFLIIKTRIIIVYCRKSKLISPLLFVAYR